MRTCGFWVCLIAAAAAGYRGPVRATTDSRVVMHNSVVEDRGPLTQMRVLRDPTPIPQGKIALIDADGLLLNCDMSGLGSLGENPVAVFRETLDCGALMPFSIPGFDRSQMPTFLYLWQPEPTLLRRAAR
jgi:hypothetical protein